jgi:hypothetical protein
MKRFQVKAGNKDWTDKGPDLLRTQDNARKALKNNLGDKTQGWHVRTDAPDGTWRDWDGPMSKADALERFDGWSPPQKEGQRIQYGRKQNDQIEVLHIVRFEDVKHYELSGCSDRAEKANDLVRHAFPKVKFAGGYVCKNYNGDPGAGWSDHAWGDAVDETENPPEVKNEDVGDWCARMCSSGNMEADYILSSRNGVAGGYYAPDWDWRNGAASSHEWHTHISVVDHKGKDPHC